MKKIGIVAAMSVESGPLQEVFGKPVNHYVYGIFDVKEYVYAGKEIYFATCTEGEITASACTQFLITKYGAELIFNYGLAGALGDYGLGKTLLVKAVVHYEFDLTPLLGGEVGKYERFPSPLVETDAAMRAKIKSICPDMEEVVCASGDKFIADSKVKQRLVDAYGAGVCEMESAGVLFTSINAGVPQVIIKVVSDSGDDAMQFVDYVNGKNTEYIKLVAKVLESL